MTMIAFKVEPDHAEILTDTLSYSRNGRTLGRTSKVHVLPHLNTAVLVQGSGELGRAWRHHLDGAGQDAADFDELDAVAQHHLPGLYEALNRRWPGGESDSIVFHIGFSPEHGRFQAHAYPSIGEYVGLDVSEEFYAMPALVSREPSPPSSIDQWVDLALAMRQERALAHVASGLKVFVGGDVIHTRLEVGASSHRRIHTFDDTGDELRQMVAGTLHPLSQLGPCPCGSGELLAHCHPLPGDQACNCGSGQVFGECCRVHAPVRQHAAAVSGVS